MAGPNGSLYVVNADGMHRRVLATQVVGGGFFSGNLSWSPDGKRIVFARKNGTLFTVATTGTAVQLRINYKRPAGLPVAMQPAWSPAGPRIAFVATRYRGSPGSIAVMWSGGGPVAALHDGTGPVWSPDSSRIAFRRDRDQVMRAGGTRVRHWDGCWCGITFSPNSAKLAYVGGGGHVPNGDLYVRNADGSGAVRVFHFQNGVIGLPLWRGGTATTEAG